MKHVYLSIHNIPLISNYSVINILVGGFINIWDVIPTPLTDIFQDGECTTNQIFIN